MTKEIKEYIKNVARSPAAYEVIRADAKSKGTSSLSLREIDREIAAVRREQSRRTKIKQLATK
jgi:hypothetical protein